MDEDLTDVSECECEGQSASAQKKKHLYECVDEAQSKRVEKHYITITDAWSITAGGGAATFTFYSHSVRWFNLIEWNCMCIQSFPDSSIISSAFMLMHRQFGTSWLLLSLFQQDFLGLVQTELQGVQFARVLLRRAHVLPQLSAAFLPAQTGR